MEKRVFLIVLDSFGIGAEPDAAAFGDAGTNTLGAIANHPNFNCPNLRKLGLFNIDGVTAGEKTDAPAAAFARLQEQSMGKDTRPFCVWPSVARGARFPRRWLWRRTPSCAPLPRHRIGEASACVAKTF